MTTEARWHKGDRVVSRFWSPGEPVGTVTAVFVEGVNQWTTVEFDDGFTRDYDSWELRTAE